MTETKDMEFEAWKMQNTANLEHYRATYQFDLEQMRVVNLAGQSALKANVFLNAGAAVATLAFLANVFNSLDSMIAYKFIIAVAIFATGALLGSIATGFTYLSQYAFDDEKRTWGSCLNATSNFMIQIAYNLFAIGGYVLFIGIGAKFDLQANICCHWIFGIIMAILNATIIVIVVAVLKSKKNPANKEK